MDNSGCALVLMAAVTGVTVTGLISLTLVEVALSWLVVMTFGILLQLEQLGSTDTE